MSLAWRDDGALAYVRGDPPAYRANLPFLANVLVRTANGGVEQWSADAARYEVAAWAGKTLLVQKDSAGGAPDLVAFDGPRSSRTLATSVLFLGVTPDGRDALVAQTAADDPHPRIRLVRVADGTEVASIAIADARDPVTDDPLLGVYGPGGWRGERVVLPSETGLLVLRVDTGSIAVDQVIHVDAATKADASLLEPRFVDDRTITAWGGVPGTAPHMQVAQYVCDRVALTCTRSAPITPAEAPRPVYDLSGGAQ